MPTKTGYTRQSSATLVDGQVATAAKFNNEYNLLETAFDATNGHVHDGTAANGGPIPQIMSTDAKDKVVVNGVSHYVGTWINVAGTTTEQVRTDDGAVFGVTDNDIDLGKSANSFKNLYLKGTLTNAGGTITFPAATDTLVGKATTDTLTNKTFDTAGTGNVFKINGTTISAKTGTGSAVLSASPTFTGTTTHANITASGQVVGTPATLTDGATVTPDFSAGTNFTWTMGGSRTLANPTNIVAGQSGVIVIKQDGTGSRVLSYGSYWDADGGTDYVLSTAANSVDILVWYAESSTHILYKVHKAFA